MWVSSFVMVKFYITVGIKGSFNYKNLRVWIQISNELSLNQSWMCFSSFSPLNSLYIHERKVAVFDLGGWWVGTEWRIIPKSSRSSKDPSSTIQWVLWEGVQDAKKFHLITKRCPTSVQNPNHWWRILPPRPPPPQQSTYNINNMRGNWLSNNVSSKSQF